jgi:hypothetical protein
MTLETFLFWIFILAVFINTLSTMLFLGRIYWPAQTGFLGAITIALGIPAFGLAMWAALAGFEFSYWLFPLLYSFFAVFALIVDYVLNIEFRQPRRLEILVPFLLLYFISLIGMWGMLWNLGIVYWAIAGVTYFAMVASSIYTARKGYG